MVMNMFLAGVAALVVAGPVLFTRYLRHLPEAPACPTCCSVTRDANSILMFAMLLPSLTATAVRECTRCGWKGRMRWRWAENRVEHQGRG